MLLISACNKEPEEGAAAADAGNAGTAAARPVQPVVVGIERLEAATDAGAIRSSGLIAYKRETILAFSAPGVIETLSVDSGDTVRAGQQLATMRRTTVGADAGEAETVRATAEREYKRVLTLQEKGFASEAALENARLALERTRERLVIEAPAGGVILSRNAERGQTMAAGAPVLTLGEARAGVVVRASVTATEAAELKVGDPAEIRIRDDELRSGKIARIAPRSAAAAGVFEIEIALSDAEGLRSGEVADVVLAGGAVAAEASPRFLIPAVAVINARADQGEVYIVENGTARRRAVETGGLIEGGVIVIDGLSPGDAVIVRGASMVRDGEPVTVAPATTN